MSSEGLSPVVVLSRDKIIKHVALGQPQIKNAKKSFFPLNLNDV